MIINGWETTGMRLPRHRKPFDDHVTEAFAVFDVPTVVAFDTMLQQSTPAPAWLPWYRRKVVPIRAVAALTTVSTFAVLAVIR